jgi:hypothetical protein
MATIAMACSVPSYAANPVYVVPTGDAGQLAYIVGSPSITSAKKKASVYVWGIDRHEVQKAERNWSKPVAVTPGLHKITVALKGVYQEFDIDLCAGCTFQAQASYSEQSGMMIKTLTSDFWIVRQSDGETITEHKPGKAIPVKLSFTSF